MRNSRWSLAGLLACTLPAACADPCLDDGLGQSGEGNCPLIADGDSESATESNTDSVTETMGSATMGSNTDSMSGSQEGNTVDDTATETAGGGVWCVDADGDGFGDPDMCTQSDDMPPGTVDNDDDCDDMNPNTFPGAAENDDPRACMNDDDDDGWGDNGDGDDRLPPGVEPGTDCDDTNENTFPGTAENEDPPDVCRADDDDDGWGDANPPGGGGGKGGPESGSDCYDTNAQLNPGTVQLTAFLPYEGGGMDPRTLNLVATDGALGDFVTLETPEGDVPDVNLVSATFNEDMQIFANDLESVQLQAVDYADTCGDGLGTIAPVGTMPYEGPGNIVCGLEFGSNGMLYGVSHTEDDLRVYDTRSGQIVGDPVPITFEDGSFLDVFSCGMARDCTEGRLLLANGVDRIILGIDEETGVATELRDLSDFFPSTWNPTGLEYDPVTRTALLSTGEELYRVNLEDDSDPELLGALAEDVSNLQYLPICM
jgi:hypothetical protein